jgi:hypothetical protein
LAPAADSVSRGELLLKHKEAFAQNMTREMGKVLNETRGDVQEAIDMSFFTAGEGRRLYGQTTPAELPNKFAMSVRMPLGVCSLITPWNFPMAIPSWKLIPALVCGNTVVIKPASDTPLSCYNLVKVCEEAGVPKGVVNLVTGSGSELGAPMMTHVDVKLVSFTGSTEIGRAVSAACAPSFKHCNLRWAARTSSWSWTMLTWIWLKVLWRIRHVWSTLHCRGRVVHKQVYKDLSRSLPYGPSLCESAMVWIPIQMGPVVNQGQSNGGEIR